MKLHLLAVAFLLLSAGMPASAQQKNLREYGIAIGVLQPGPLNAITDVPGVQVGHTTLIRGDDVRTGVTAVLRTPATSSRAKCRPRSTSATASAS